MGFLSWFSSTANKSKAAVLVQVQLEGASALFKFNGDPMLTANSVIQRGCEGGVRMNVSAMDPGVLAIFSLSYALADKKWDVETKADFCVILGRLMIELTSGVRWRSITERERKCVIACQELWLRYSERDVAGVPRSMRSGVDRACAVIIRGDVGFEAVLEERRHLDGLFGPSGWSMVSQRTIEEEGKMLDELTIRRPGKPDMAFWFELSPAATQHGN